MAVPKLAPRPGGVVASIVHKPPAVLMHSDVEWTALYPNIERLYVRERRKLRYVMQYMESEHSFKATYETAHFAPYCPNIFTISAADEMLLLGPID
jgi:Clr5 domain